MQLTPVFRRARGHEPWNKQGVRTRTALVVLAVTAAAREARAGEFDDEPRWRLIYDARAGDGDGCPTRTQAKSLVVARLGFDPFREEDGATSTLHMTVRPEGTGLRAVVEHRDDGEVVGERAVQAEASCADVVAALALASSILVDPTGAMAKRRAARSAPPPDARSTRAEDPMAREADGPSTAPRASTTLGVGARLLGSAGLAPGPSAGISLDGALRRGAFELRVEGRTDLPVSAEPLPDGAGVATTLVLGSLVPCYVRGAVRLCAVLSAGAMLARSENLQPVERDATFFAAAGLRPLLTIPVGGPLRVVASVEVVVPLRQLAVTVRAQEVWSSAVVAGTAGLGIEAHFP